MIARPIRARANVLAVVLALVTPHAAARAQSAPAPATPAPAAADVRAYYRFPAVHGGTVVFVAEGDLWKVPVSGGIAQRLTTHPSEETRPAISPDGSTIAFTARYEGPAEVYTMPIDGGLPTRQTWDGGGATVAGWTPDGRILYATTHYATLPTTQLVMIDPRTHAKARVPLAQAADATWLADGRTIVFTRFSKQSSNTRRYKGGTAENLWKFVMPASLAGIAGGVTRNVFTRDGAIAARPAAATSTSGSQDSAGRGPFTLASTTATLQADEARPLTADYPGTSRNPMAWNGRVYFASDRDGVMNVWSMDANGGDLKQHTRHADYDVLGPSMHDGRIVYQDGADLWLFDARSSQDTKLDIRLASDFDHMRERWVDDPADYLTSSHLSPSGDRVVLTARGQVFVAPVASGRFVEATRGRFVRYREAAFMPDGRELIALSDESGEVELWTLPSNGMGERKQLTSDGAILRWEAVPSPDGKLIAHHDKNQRLYIYDTAKKENREIARSANGGFGDLAWSPDGRWLAFVETAADQLTQIRLFDTRTNRATAATTDRYDSYSPAWSPDGKWLYLLSDRNFQSSVGAPWGSRQPDPFFERQAQIFALSLRAGQRSPFEPKDELAGPATPASDAKTDDDASKSSATPRTAPQIEIDLDGLQRRLFNVPAPAGNYSSLTTDGKRLYWVARDMSPRKQTVMTMEITGEKPKPAAFMEDAGSYELSADRKKILVRKGDDLYVVPAGAKAPEKLADAKVDLGDWSFAIDPREEWHQSFVDAWRLERDYFYDPGMHGLDWPAMREKYMPLAERVSDRAELNDVLAQMVSELSALHIFVRGGDQRTGEDDIAPASLGAVLERDEAAGGWRVTHIYRNDPDIPDEIAPLARPGVDVMDGDVIVAINGTATLSVDDPAELLRNQAGRQVRLRVRAGSARPAQTAGARGAPPNSSSPAARGGAMAERDVIVTPITQSRESDLRYDEWEYSRRVLTDQLGNGRIGYVHLRAMGGGDIAQFTRDFYPVFNREGIILDARHNRGGNIDSWVLGKLARQAWMYWKPRVGDPYWNMQYAPIGHMVVLVDENTASDGEAFAEGFRRLGLGKVIGTRTWGGEIWLSSSNFLADRGIATAAETGVYGPEGEWLIEGWGVDPDIVVDNLPRATYDGTDAQIEAAIAYLFDQIRQKPVTVPPPPAYPVKK